MIQERQKRINYDWQPWKARRLVINSSRPSASRLDVVRRRIKKAGALQFFFNLSTPIMSDTKLPALESFLQNFPTIKYISPVSPEYPTARKVFKSDRPDNPLAIVQPQSPSDLCALIKYAKSQSLQFTIRCGGHNLEGRVLVEGALLIDIRALNAVTIAPDRQTATVQGGILQEELGNKLWAEGLATPIGSIPSVGYVGWATYGGYGPFSGHWGLGVDQILGATIINHDGEILKAEESILRGIRGAGGLFGVILDLTIKVYPMTSVRLSL